MDESRKAFEQWWEVNYHNGNPPRFGWEAWREGDGYKVDDDESELDGMWQAWQASRAAIEIELPAGATKNDERLRHETSHEGSFNLCLYWAQNAIYAAGIKVKE